MRTGSSLVQLRAIHLPPACVSKRPISSCAFLALQHTLSSCRENESQFLSTCSAGQLVGSVCHKQSTATAHSFRTLLLGTMPVGRGEGETQSKHVLCDARRQCVDLSFCRFRLTSLVSVPKTSSTRKTSPNWATFCTRRAKTSTKVSLSVLYPRQLVWAFCTSCISAVVKSYTS